MSEQQTATGELMEREFDPRDTGALAMLNKSEIDMQIATAKKFPRSVTAFVTEATGLVSLNEEVAGECIYALPRDGKTIEGASARLAEILAYSWGNCRSAARVVDESGDFVTAQGVHWDLQKNTAIGYEVKRRIVNSKGKRYSADMIGVTANAACSIALRNAILKGIPKALWAPIYETARRTIMGDFKTLASRRQTTLETFQKFGVRPEQVFEKLGVKGDDDITLEHILVLRGLLTALRDGDTTVEEQFPPKAPEGSDSRSAKDRLKAALQPQGDAQPAGDTTIAPEVGSTESAPVSPVEDTPKAAPEGKPAKRGKQDDPGTPEILAKLAKRMAEASDREILDLAQDESRLWVWSMSDAEVLTSAYRRRAAELAGK